MRMKVNAFGRFATRTAAEIGRAMVRLRDGFNWGSVHVSGGKAGTHMHKHSEISISLGRPTKEAACIAEKAKYGRMKNEAREGQREA